MKKHFLSPLHKETMFGINPTFFKEVGKNKITIGKEFYSYYNMRLLNNFQNFRPN